VYYLAAFCLTTLQGGFVVSGARPPAVGGRGSRRDIPGASPLRKTTSKGTAGSSPRRRAHCPLALTQALAGCHRLAGVLLGCPEQAAGYGRGAAGVLALLDGASERCAEVVTQSQVLAAYEDSTSKHSWRHVGGRG